ncbi:MAG: hypothetical protein H6Q04_3264 [Acidobacteria bacterium]|nr:hypothetical protein [Acidobacteriota bacterium]
MKNIERNFWLDISLFVTFLSTVLSGLLLWLVFSHQAAAIILGFNRYFWLTAHICSGLASVAGSVVHVIWHRDWLKALRKRPITSLPSKLRANRVLDRFVWITFLATSAFGAFDYIIPAREISVNNSSRLHLAFGMAWLLGITVHLALHNKWIAFAARRHLRVM